jgi:myo-inositol-1(or 4)-monophosphatase
MNDKTDLSKAARAAEQAAYAAGTHLQASRSRLAETLITRQAPSEVVAAIEAETRALIREVVHKHFPDHRFVGAGDAQAGAHRPDDAQPHWIVHPIDGSANYLRGYPQYAVAIALVEAGEPQLGVVYDPCRNEFFGAIRGRGAVLNGEPMRCERKRRSAGESLAATVFPQPSSPRMPVYMAELGRVLRAFSGVRRSGSMALELAYLAAGRIDAFWEHDTGAWHAAAGSVLLRESGALISARDGLPLLRTDSLLACTPQLYEPFLSLLAEP